VDENVAHKGGLDGEHKQRSVEHVCLVTCLQLELLLVALKEGAVRYRVDIRGQLQVLQRLVRLFKLVHLGLLRRTSLGFFIVCFVREELIRRAAEFNGEANPFLINVEILFSERSCDGILVLPFLDFAVPRCPLKCDVNEQIEVDDNVLQHHWTPPHREGAVQLPVLFDKEAVQAKDHQD
jgi:hypothetical protein